MKTKDGKHSHETNYGLLSKRYNVDELVLFVPVKIWFGDSFVNSRGCEGAQREGNEGDMGTTFFIAKTVQLSVNCEKNIADERDTGERSYRMEHVRSKSHKFEHYRSEFVQICDIAYLFRLIL